jgi:hypothetical protein
LDKTLLELTSAKEVIRVLQQKGNLKKYIGDEGTGECKSHHDKRPVQVETKETTGFK